MRYVVMIFFVLSFQVASAQCSGIDEKETFPWPWSTQCPFPWESIEGKWMATTKTGNEVYYDFRVISQTQDGEHYLIVTEYNEEMKILARGVGYSRRGELGVLAAMHWYAEDQHGGFWLQVSSFVDEQKATPLACVRKNLKTAVKMTPFGQIQDNEAPLIIEKMPASTGLAI